jgi:hypothetical protein
MLSPTAGSSQLRLNHPLRVLFLLSSVAVASTLAPAARAEDNVSVTAAEANEVFEALSGMPGASKDGVGGELVKYQAESLDFGENGKLTVFPPVDRPPVRTYRGRPVGSAIRIWGEILTGRDAGKLVNLQRYKFQPTQRFKLHVQSAYPLSMAVYQTFPEDRPPSKQVSPVDRVPESFSVIPAAADFAVPIEFELDNDQRDEQIQFIFCRGDSRDAPQNLIRRENRPSYGNTCRTIRKGFDKLQAHRHQESSRCIDDGDRPTTGRVPSDVGILYMNAGFIHAGQITLHK